MCEIRTSNPCSSNIIGDISLRKFDSQNERRNSMIMKKNTMNYSKTELKFEF